MIKHDPSHDFLNIPPHPLSIFFEPNSIALIGATESENSVGRTLVSNLISGGYKGKIYPINPKREKVFDLPCFTSVKKVKDPIDLAIIITPAKTVPAIINECGEKGIKAAIIISAGFKEMGAPGIRLEKEVLMNATKHNMRIIGPNCLGLMNPLFSFNATFAKGMALPGQMAFISQSGAMCTAVLDWSLEKKIGFSAFLSIGSMSDISFGDLIDYLGNDPNTQSILIYMESVGNPRAFLSAAREVALSKPIILIKAGKTLAAAKAAASHTGSLAGSDEVFDVALHRAGVLRVNSINELFNMALVLAMQPIPMGPNLSIITNAGGPAVLATDAAIENGAKLAPLSTQLIEKLNEFLPNAWSHSNPIDILGDASPQSYGKTLELVCKDPGSDGVLVILSPQDMTDPLSVANEITKIAKNSQKPILASWMGGNTVKSGIQKLEATNIPNFSFPDSAAKIFATMWKHSQDIFNSYETPALASDDVKLKKQQLEVSSLLQNIFDSGRTILTEFEAKKILEIYGISVAQTYVAKSREEAISKASMLTYPVVLKLFSETITHKSDVGGVKLNLKNAEAVKQAFEEIRSSVSALLGSHHFQGVTVQPMVKTDGFELILGSSIDEQFGPIILFGQGGALVEVFKDNALALPPLNMTLARRLIQKTKIYTALKGVRGKKGINFEELQSTLVRFSQLIAKQPLIKECDINPLLVSEKKIIALDARIILINQNEKPAKLAIRPYPLQYTTTINLGGQESILLRPIRPEDEPGVVQFHKSLSEDSVKNRYLELFSLDDRTTHQRLIRICCGDYDRTIAIVAEIEGQIVAITRFTKIFGSKEAKFSIIVTDKMQNRGLGTKMLTFLFHVAKEEGLDSLYAEVLNENIQMIRVCQKLGLDSKPHAPDMIRVIRAL